MSAIIRDEKKEGLIDIDKDEILKTSVDKFEIPEVKAFGVLSSNIHISQIHKFWSHFRVKNYSETCKLIQLLNSEYLLNPDPHNYSRVEKFFDKFIKIPEDVVNLSFYFWDAHVFQIIKTGPMFYIRSTEDFKDSEKDNRTLFAEFKATFCIQIDVGIIVIIEY